MSKNKNLKLVPVFKNEDEEREFWTTHNANARLKGACATIALWLRFILCGMGRWITPKSWFTVVSLVLA